MNRRILAACAAAFLIACPPAFAAGGGGHDDVGKTSSRLSSAASYVPLPSINTASSGGRGMSGMLSVDFGLDIPDAALRARTVSMQPRLMDALRTAVSEYALTRIRAGAPPDPDQLAMMAQAAADRTVGRPGVKVLITNLMLNARR